MSYLPYVFILPKLEIFFIKGLEMIKTLNGIPGSGKNVLATHYAIKHYKRENSLLRRCIRRCLREPVYINNVYTSYPVLLKKGTKKRRPVYSNRVSLFDLNCRYSFLPNALIIIDETQVIFDSEEHKDFPKDIATFNQFHRHFDISDIIYITQHPSRLMKKLRILCCEYDKIQRFFVIPIIGLGIMSITSYFEFDDYGKYPHPKKEAKTYDVKNHLSIFFVRKVFRAYHSKYMRILIHEKPLLSKGTYEDLSLSDAEIRYVFRDKIPVSQYNVE